MTSYLGDLLPHYSDSPQPPLPDLRFQQPLSAQTRCVSPSETQSCNTTQKFALAPTTLSALARTATQHQPSRAPLQPRSAAPRRAPPETSSAPVSADDSHS
ncbi:hypothetical protein ACLB2K_047093 [Fragaria x ananassa]